jgi:CheY-like chemotaxis protein
MPESVQAVGRILVVDDQPANLRVVSTLLARNGFEVASALTGAEALEQAVATIPDLVCSTCSCRAWTASNCWRRSAGIRSCRTRR